MLALYLKGLALVLDLYAIGIEMRHLVLEVELDATLRVLLTQECSQLAVHSIDDLGEHLNHRDGHAHLVVVSCELHADDATTDDDDRGGKLLAVQCLSVGNVVPLLDTWYRRDNRL